MSNSAKKSSGQSGESASSFNHLSVIGVREVKPFVPPASTSVKSGSTKSGGKAQSGGK